MKTMLFFIAFLFSSCSSARQSWLRESTVSDTAFTSAQAERILGVSIGESEVGRGNGCIVYEKSWCFREVGADAFNWKGAMVSAFVTIGGDSATVASWYTSESRKMGRQDSNRVAGIGDDAHIWMSREECMIHARKGKYLISFYLRPSERSTRDEFVRVAGEVVASL